jgi:hypothetical protein
MSLLKKFLERRGNALAGERPEIRKADKITGRKQDAGRQNKDLSDDDFWAILRQYKEQMTENPGKSPEEILEAVLEPYTPEQIIQFAERYEKLNK